MTTTPTPKPKPKPRRERIRSVYKSIIRDYMIQEQWRATCGHDKRCQCRYCSYYNKQWRCWREGRLYDGSIPNGEYPATLPQTEAQLLKVLEHSVYPKLESRKTIRRCLDEMVEDGVLYRYHDVGGSSSNRKQKYNQKPYIFPLQSMPSRDVLLFFEINRLMALRVDPTLSQQSTNSSS